ncbi:MAG TPA: serpin family protein, partial [Acidobacteriota bacterium]|nr:serpin family protein [Acidobacteriota bacterium]
MTALFCVPCFPAEDEESLTGCLAEGNTEFALKLYGELRSGEENIFFSPFSVSSAMAMAYSGARQNTAKEMKEALCFH